MNTLYMMVGLPGSGKSTYAQNLFNNNSNSVLLSSDKIREELFGDECSQDNNKAVFSEMRNRATEALCNGKDVIYDATNVSYADRKRIINIIKNLRQKVVAIIIATPYEECIRQNNNRGRVVPEDVIIKMMGRWNTPSLGEGFDKIEIIFNDPTYKGIYGSCFTAYCDFLSYDQKNRYHNYSLGRHIHRTKNKLVSNCGDEIRNYTLVAAYLHDIAKPLVVTEDDDGYHHFYNHANVGAYMSLFYSTGLNDNDLLKASQLVNYHMLFMKPGVNEKTYERYAKRLGAEEFDELLKLHKADRDAHL